MAEEGKPREALLRLPQFQETTSGQPSDLQLTQEVIYRASVGGMLRQGEILTELVQLIVDLDSIKSGEEYLISSKNHPLAIVVTQDCDLSQDFIAREKKELSSDKIIPSVLFCEVITAEELRGVPGAGLNKDQWNRVKINKDERYHFLEKVPAECDTLGAGLDELGIDFKRYFSIPTDEVYYRLENDAKRRCRLLSPYLEHFSTRFYYFQSRVALPAEHRSE